MVVATCLLPQDGAAGDLSLPRRSLSAIKAMAGLYVIVARPNLSISANRINEAALNSGDVDGMYIRASWDTVEPSPDHYDWSYFDTALAEIGAAHKKAFISIAAGVKTPKWVYDQGAASFDTVVEIPRRPDFCDPARLPVPWDPVFLSRWKRLIAAFGKRFGQNPIVTQVKVTGVNYYSEEISLPFQRQRVMISLLGSEKRCELPDDIQHWQTLGYSTSKIDDAFTSILRSFATSFPTKPLAIMTSFQSFPPLGAGGETAPQATRLGTTDLLRIGRNLLGDGFVGQNNGLTADKLDPDIASFASTNPTGYEAAWPVTGDDRNCFMNGGRKPCDDKATIMHGALDRAVAAGALYVELFASDVLNPKLGDALHNAHIAFSKLAQ